MDFSADGGTVWANRSTGLATNMFYDLEVAQANDDFIAGGAQDNGTLATVDGQAHTYFELTGGDGGWVVIDPQDPNHLFTTWQFMGMMRFRASDGWKTVSPPEDQAKPWMMFVAMDPKNRKTLFTGSRRVWRTKDDGDTWTAVSEVLDGSDITTVEVARADAKRVYIGTENGGFFRSSDGGATWSDNLASTLLPGRTLTRVQSRAEDADVVYATVANFGTRHLFRSADGGLNWTDIDRGELPDAPALSIALPAAHPERIYVCGDAGVFVSDDEGSTWANLTGNLPNVPVVDLVYHEQEHLLTAATYGRSIWRLSVD
ncbi:WD40/YVTN/BNR-like repeat-containing protein [Rhodococcus aetherivorans]